MTTIKRLPDWRERLSTVVEARRRDPFTEKENCGVFLADCILAMTGFDPAADVRGRFKNRAEALVLLRKKGHADLPAFLSSFLEEISPVFARYGDVMAFPTDETGWAGGIVNGERVLVLTPVGVGTVSRNDAMRAFRIP